MSKISNKFTNLSIASKQKGNSKHNLSTRSSRSGFATNPKYITKQAESTQSDKIQGDHISNVSTLDMISQVFEQKRRIAERQKRRNLSVRLKQQLDREDEGRFIGCFRNYIS